jgi:hypothetical protein
VHDRPTLRTRFAAPGFLNLANVTSQGEQRPRDTQAAAATRESALARKNHAKVAAMRVVRARWLFNSRCAAVKEPDLEEMDRSRLSLNPSLQKAAEFFGEAEEFRC